MTLVMGALAVPMFAERTHSVCILSLASTQHEEEVTSYSQ